MTHHSARRCASCVSSPQSHVGMHGSCEQGCCARDWAPHSGAGHRYEVPPGVGPAQVGVYDAGVPEASPHEDLVVRAVPRAQLHVRLVRVH